MYTFLASTLLAAGVILTTQASAFAQAKDEPPFVRDNSAMTLPYVLAGLGVILVMVLVCTPARRE